MKLLFVKLLALTAIFVTLSCGTVDYAKKYPNMVANADPVSAGTTEVQFNRFLSSKVNKSEIEVIFYPRLNAVALEFRHELIRHRQFWDAQGRKQFAQSLDLYKDDYEAHNLVDRYRKTRALYGKVPVRVEWEAFKYNKTRIAYPTIEIGYCFKEGMPFFTTLMRSAKEEADYGDSSPRGESAQISMFFTRAQADELVKLFDQDYLMGLLGKTHSPQSGDQDEEAEIEIDLRPYREME
jgi:hypothetical protein